MDMDDIDDLSSKGDLPPTSQVAAPRASRFLPKSSSKLKPKLEPASSSQLLDTLIQLKKQQVEEEEEEEEDSKMLVDPGTKIDQVIKAEKKEVEEQFKKDETMEEANAEDQIAREIDVFFQPSCSLDSNTQLYVVQQPLRPSWRPYDFQKCLEVRLKPTSKQIEVDLKLEMDDNYDEDVEDVKRITKQTLYSKSAPLRTNYAVGLLVGNKLHLIPVNAVVSLRPSMGHLKVGGSKNNIAIENVDGIIKSEQGTEEKPIGTSMRQGKPESTSTQQNIIGEESWVSLEYHGLDSSFTNRYWQRMVVQQRSPIQFSMSPYDYVNSLCPGSSTENNRTGCLLKSFLLSQSLDERFKNWFAKGSQVNRFNTLKYLAPDDSNEDIMRVLQRYADLVQGLWVSKTKVLGLTGDPALVRDYTLLLFRKNTLVLHKEIEDSLCRGVPRGILKKVLEEVVLNKLAVYRPKFKDWKFEQPVDISFIKEHPDIVSEQEQRWRICEKEIMEAVSGSSGPLAKNSLKPYMSNKHGASASANQGPKRTVDEAPQTGMVTMSDETREALPRALEYLTRLHKVCSLQLICQGLRDLAVSKSALPKADARAAVAAARGASAPLPELQFILNQVATNIHGVYVSKSSDNPALNPLRSVVIDLFSVKEPNAPLKKAEIVEAARIKLKKEINKNEYTQVLNELCVSIKGNAWILKSGDGNLK